MIRTFGALGLLLSLSACSQEQDNLFQVDGLDSSATAKSLPPGASIEDCLNLVVTGDTADTGLSGTEAWCPDEDGDGYYDADSSDPFGTGCLCIVAGTLSSEYVQVDETTVLTKDCDDGDASVTSASTTVYTDSDSDGYGDSGTAEMACVVESGFATVGGDCDDTNSAVNPGAIEMCDTVDNDCDGNTDDASATDVSTWYADADSDSYGDGSVAEMACDALSGYVADSTDCNDTDAAVNPGAMEVCDSGLDNDCDGASDDADSDVVTLTGSESWPDADSDSYGDESASSTWSCTVPSGSVENDDDCNDSDAGINPGATEIADDGIDQDCSGADEVTTSGTDADGDGFDSEASGGTDCDDTDATVNPDAAEVSLDGVDNNCDGAANSSDIVEICVTPESALSGFTWQLWLRDGTVDEDGSATSTWDFPGAVDGIGELCASTTVTDGNTELINGPFDIDGDSVFGEEAVDGDGVWAYMLDGNHISSVTGNGYALSIVDAPWSSGNDGEWDVDLQ